MKWQILVMIFCLMVAGTSSLTQESENVIYVSFGYSPELQAYAQDFYSQLEQSLESSTPYSILRWVDYPEPINLRVGLRDPEGQIGINFSLRTPASFDISPFLETQYDQQYDLGGIFDYVYSPNDTTTRDSTIKLLVGLGLYSVGNCLEADTLLHEASNILDGFKVEYVRAFDKDLLPAQISFYRANCAVLRNDYSAAIELYQDALLYYGKNSGRAAGHLIYFAPAINLTWVYLKIGDSGKAFALMNLLVASAPYSNYSEQVFRIRLKQVQLYALAFRYDDAIKAMDALIEIAPNDPELYVMRGQMILLTYEWDAVLSDYNKAIELDPNYADAYFYRGVLFYTQGPREQALEDFERYLELAPDGEHAEEAAKYIDSIKVELEALGQ
jgi:tetratricopeptide (TPR) repeat protein